MYTHFTVVCIKVYMNNDTNYCNKSAVHIYGGKNAPNSDVHTNAPNYWCTNMYTNAPNYWWTKTQMHQITDVHCTITQMHQITDVQLHKCTKLLMYIVQLHKCAKLLMYNYTNAPNY